MNAHDMEKTIEIPEGYEARIEGSKVILELKGSEDERIRQAIESIIRVYGKTQGEWLAGYDMDTLVVHLRDAFASLERQKEKPICLSTGARKRLIETIWSDIEECIKGVSYFPFSKSQKEQKPAEKQDYSGLTELEGAIHRGFLCAGVENVPVAIIKETANECLARMKPAEWSEESETIDQLAEEYVEGVKKCNDAPTLDLIHTAVCYGYELGLLQERRNKYESK